MFRANKHNKTSHGLFLIIEVWLKPLRALVPFLYPLGSTRHIRYFLVHSEPMGTGLSRVYQLASWTTSTTSEDWGPRILNSPSASTLQCNSRPCPSTIAYPSFSISASLKGRDFHFIGSYMESAWVLHFLEFTNLKCLSNAENSHHITLKTIIIIEIWWPLKSENLNFNLNWSSDL